MCTQASTSLEALTLHTGPASKVAHEGYGALFAALRNNNSLTELTLGKVSMRMAFGL